MDDRYRAIYNQIYSASTDPGWSGLESQRLRDEFGPPPPEAGAIVQDAVEAADNSVQRLREDAKALLAVNFRELVVLPLFVVKAETPDLIREDVRADVAMLVRDAQPEQTPSGSEISGHAVIDSLSRNWTELRVSRFRLWEQTGD